MLHELLLTLSGYPGGVFVEDARTGTVKVRNLSFKTIVTLKTNWINSGQMKM